MWRLLSLVLVAACTGDAARTERDAAPPSPLFPVVARDFLPPASPANPTTEAQLAFATADLADAPPQPPPGPEDWLASFREPGQGFETYVTSDPPGVGGRRRVLVLQPVGAFPARQLPTLERLARFASLWFGVPVRLQPALALPGPPDRQRRVGRREWEQYLTGPLLGELLLPRLPAEAIAFLGVTPVDLYPDERWNFVCGWASLYDRVGIYSTARLGSEPRGDPASRGDDDRMLERTLKIVVHEAGHMFGLPHCRERLCNMNGANSVEEIDRKPLRLCPECLRKLQWRLGFDVLARYDALAAFCEEVGLREEAEWFHRRAARIRAVPSGAVAAGPNPSIEPAPARAPR